MTVTNLSPKISIITATYNRSNVLRYTIESVLQSTFSDWELLVIGDACTDDTEQTVASFEDPRVRFSNLDHNFGEQSGPNNEGFRQSSGRFIAYLNHDDLFFPDHLDSSLQLLERSGADLVYAATATAARRSKEELERGEWKFSVLGASLSGRYEPYVYAPASSWLCRRELIETIGPWRPAVECYMESSQDFLFRAWKAGKDLRFKPGVTVLAVQSGTRKDTYKNREDYENRFYTDRMRSDGDFREKVLSSLALNLAGRAGAPKLHFNLKRTMRKLIYHPALWLGCHPRAVRALLKHGRRGAAIKKLREVRGLKPISR